MTESESPSSCSDISDDFDEMTFEYFGEEDGKKLSLPEIVSLVSDTTLEPPLRPTLPITGPQILRDLCAECWNKNPSRRPTTEEIVDRLSAASSDSTLMQQLVTRSTVFDSILPQDVQERLSRGESVPPQKYDEVTVIFSDVVGFTSTSAKLKAEEVGDLIYRLFTKFDALAAKFGIKKLDVIGDAFLGVAGVPDDCGYMHTARAACFALQATEAANQIPVCPTKPELGVVHVRFGLATGPVVASVIGSAQHPKYTLFGTTVNTASRMESSSEPDRVQCTKETGDMIKQYAPQIDVEFRAVLDIKGRGEMETYFLNPPVDGYGSIEVVSITEKKPDDRRASLGEMAMRSSTSLNSADPDKPTPRTQSGQKYMNEHNA